MLSLLRIGIKWGPPLRLSCIIDIQSSVCLLLQAVTTSCHVTCPPCTMHACPPSGSSLSSPPARTASALAGPAQPNPSPPQHRPRPCSSSSQDTTTHARLPHRLTCLPSLSPPAAPAVYCDNIVGRREEIATGTISGNMGVKDDNEYNVNG